MTDKQLQAVADYIIGATRGIVAEAANAIGARIAAVEANQTLLVEHVKTLTQRLTLTETRLDRAAE